MNDLLRSRKEFIVRCYDAVAVERNSWILKNRYYYDYLKKILGFLIEPQSTVLQLKCETGYYLDAVSARYGIGLDASREMVRIAKQTYPKLDFEVQDLENIHVRQKFDYVLLVNALGDILDLQRLFHKLESACDANTRIIIINYNPIWQPLINLANLLKLKIRQPTQNWLTAHDIENLLYLSGYEVVKQFNILLCPLKIPFFSFLLNNFLARLPLIEKLCLDHVFVARRTNEPAKNENNQSVSVVVPCKNEKGNIEQIVQRMPVMGKWTEIIFCDDKSEDGTSEEILRMQREYPHKGIRLVHGPGICKSKNVWAGFEAAGGDILMIFDADLTVIPEELPYFYRALVARKAEFINGSRLVYALEEGAMPLSKMFGNKFLSTLFSYILDQKIKDTLCGTKVLWRRDFERLKKYIGTWGAEDQWGDYDLLFGATKLNLKILDLPVHYFERTYGATKMNNIFSSGARMLRISLTALKKLKFF